MKRDQQWTWDEAVSSFDPRETPYDLYFVLFGIPVRVHPFFWLVAVFLGLHASDLFSLIAWVLAVFIAVLAHEMGHALAMRAFGYYPSVTLYGLGGYTRYGLRAVGTLPPRSGGRILISAAGPLAGFLLVLFLLLLLSALRVPLIIKFAPPLGLHIFAEFSSPWLSIFVYYLFFISIAWGVLNLLPVLPLDGGHIMEELLCLRNPTWGRFRAGQISFVVAAAVALWAVMSGNFFLAILFAYLAYANYRGLAGPLF